MQTSARRAWFVCALLLMGSVEALAYADCSGQQVACINNCLLTRKGDVGCVNQCTERSLACIQNEFNKSSESSRSSRDPDDDYDSRDDNAPAYEPPPPPPSRPPRAAPPPPPATSTYGGGSRTTIDTRDFSQCYDTFYDPAMYHWLSVRNTCSETIDVVWICKTCGERSGSAATIRPGKKESTGLSAEEVARKGGLLFAACGDGYHAAGDTNGGSWRGGERYFCKRR